MMESAVQPFDHDWKITTSENKQDVVPICYNITKLQISDKNGVMRDLMQFTREIRTNGILPNMFLPMMTQTWYHHITEDLKKEKQIAAKLRHEYSNYDGEWKVVRQKKHIMDQPTWCILVVAMLTQFTLERMKFNRSFGEPNEEEAWH